MKIEILRLSHRLPRDSRTTTHVALTARALGASKMYYSGQHDSEMESGIIKVVDSFGGIFNIEYVDSEIKLLRQLKKEGFKIINLTMYGEFFDSNKVKDIKSFDKLLIIVGSEKVEGKFYDIADINLSITSQPISEVSALGILLYEVNGIKDIDGKIKIIPNKKGKTIINKK